MRKNLQVIADSFKIINEGLERLKYLLTPVKSGFRRSDLKGLTDVFELISTSDGLPKGWTSENEEKLRDLENLFKTAAAKSEKYEVMRSGYRKITLLPTDELRALLKPVGTDFASWTRIVKPKFWKWKKAIRQQLIANVNNSYPALRSYVKLANDLEDITEWFRSREKILSAHVQAPIANAQRLKNKAAHFRVAEGLRTAISKGAISNPKEKFLEISVDDRKKALAIKQLLDSEDLRSAAELIESFWPEGFVNGNAIDHADVVSVVERSIEVLESIQKMHEWNVLQSLISKCKNLGLEAFLKVLEKIEKQTL